MLNSKGKFKKCKVQMFKLSEDKISMKLEYMQSKKKAKYVFKKLDKEVKNNTELHSMCEKSKLHYEDHQITGKEVTIVHRMKK